MKKAELFSHFKPFSHMSSSFLLHCISGDSTLRAIHTWCFICGHWFHSDVSKINGGLRGVGLQGTEYNVGSKFARGGISAAAVTLVCFGLTTDSIEAERAEVIVFNLDVAAMMHHIFRCIHHIRSIDRWFCLISHITNTGTNVVYFCV